MLRRIFLLAGIFIILCVFPAGMIGQELFTLEDCIEIAMNNNPQYRSAEHRLGIASSNVLGSYSGILPQFSMSYSSRESRYGPSTRQQDVPKGYLDPQGKFVITHYEQEEITVDSRVNINHGGTISLRQTLYDGGRWWNRIKQSKKDEKAAELNLESEKLNLVSLVKQRYFQLLKEKRQLEVFQQSLALAEENLRNSESRYEIGVAAQIDVYRSRVNRNEARIAILNQENQIELAKASLNEVMGRDIDMPIDVMEDSEDIPELDLSFEEVLAIAMVENPGVKASDVNYESSRYGLKLAKATLLPSISSNISYGRNNPTFERLYTPMDKNYSWNFSLSVSYSIFDGFTTKSNILNAERNLEIAEENKRSTRLNLSNLVRLYYLNLKNNLELIALYRDNLIEAEENVRLAEERYKVGAGTLLETIDAQENLTRARNNLVRAQYDAKTAKAQLEALMGS